MIEFDATINLGNIILALTFLITTVLGSIGVVWSLRSDVTSLNKQMTEMNGDIKKITEVLVMLGRQDERLTSQSKRIDDVVARVDKMLIVAQHAVT